MSKKLIYLASFVLWLSIVLTNTVNAADQSLVGLWRLGEGAGTMVFDSCGNGNDASFEGSPAWVEDEKFGKAVKFNVSFDYLAALTPRISSQRLDFTKW